MKKTKPPPSPQVKQQMKRFGHGKGKDPWPVRCSHVSPGGRDKDGALLPKRGTRCGDYKGHVPADEHTVLQPSFAPWFGKP